MFTEAEYVALKALKNRSPEEETRWQTVREERRRVLNNESKRAMRAGSSEEQKIKERERNRKQRAKLTEEEAAASTKRNTERRRQARARAAEGKTTKVLVIEVSENNEIISKKSVSLGVDADVAPLPELGDVGDQLAMLAVQPAKVAQGLVAEDLPVGRGLAQLSEYEIIRARNIAERELAWEKYM